MALLRVERNPAFWQRIADHPEVKPHVGLGWDVDLSEVIPNAAVVPLASEHGGFLLIRMDALGRAYELHTMFEPEAWGSREILLAAKEMFATMFRLCDLIVTHEVDGWKRSQPPKSFGFWPAGEFRPGHGHMLRTWILTRVDWEASKARGRMS